MKVSGYEIFKSTLEFIEHSNDNEFNERISNVKELYICGYNVDSDDVVRYIIDIQSKSSYVSSYTIRRRYSDFVTLYKSLSELSNISNLNNLPKIPSSGMISYIFRYNEKFLRSRMACLQKLLDVANTIPFKYTDAVSIFIGENPIELTTVYPSYISLRDYKPRVLDAEQERERARNRATSFSSNRSQFL